METIQAKIKFKASKSSMAAMSRCARIANMPLEKFTESYLIEAMKDALASGEKKNQAKKGANS